MVRCRQPMPHSSPVKPKAVRILLSQVLCQVGACPRTRPAAESGTAIAPNKPNSRDRRAAPQGPTAPNEPNLEKARTKTNAFPRKVYERNRGIPVPPKQSQSQAEARRDARAVVQNKANSREPRGRAGTGVQTKPIRGGSQARYPSGCAKQSQFERSVRASVNCCTNKANSVGPIAVKSLSHKGLRLVRAIGGSERYAVGG